MKAFALLVPMLYCDLLADAMTKGLGQQTACARYSILSNVADISLMYFLLPRFGIDGYFLSFALTPPICSTLRRLRPKFSAWVRAKLRKYPSMPNRGRR